MAPFLWLLPRALCPVLLIVATSGSAGTKLDLSPYVGNLGIPGDFKVFSFKDGERRVTLLEVTLWKKGWREIVESKITGTGEGDGAALFEDFLIPGKQLLSGSELYDDGLMLFAKKPAKGLKLLVDPAKPQRLKQSLVMLVPCQSGLPCRRRIGTAKRSATWTIEGVEDVSTPSGDHANALRVSIVSGLQLRAPPDEVVYTWRSRSWYAAGFGLVRTEVVAEVTVNRQPQPGDSWVEELISGELLGVPFP